MFHRVYRPELRFHSIMANILDQYEEASQKYNVPTNITKHGFPDVRLEDETPMFSKKRVNFQPTDKIIHLSVSNEIIIIAMANNILLRINLRQPDHPEEIELSKHTSHCRLSGLYLDPTGQHTLLSMVSKNMEMPSELLYLAKTSTKLKPLSKVRGNEVTAVAWNYFNNSRSSTGPILLGTARGLLFETEISGENEGLLQSGLEEYWKQVFDIGKGSNTPITGMHMHRAANSDKYTITVTTANKIYQFKGYCSEDKPMLQQVFKTYLSVPEKYEVVHSLLPYSKLDFYYSGVRDGPKRFGWLTGNGIYHSQIDANSEEELKLDNCELLKFPGPPEEAGPHETEACRPPPAPLAFVLTEFHALLLYPDHVKGVSLLNHHLVFEDYYTETYGKLGCITREPNKGTIWAYTERHIFSYKVIQEDRNIWQIYAERGDFELAKTYCRDNPLYLDQVTLCQAEKLFQDGDYESSAYYYSKTVSVSFEEIALKFLRVSEIDPLKKFLKLKLRGLKREEKTQITMIVIWLIELFLGQLGVLREEGKEGTKGYEDIQKDFESFMSLAEVQECMCNNKGTVYDLMATHGDKRNLIKLTIANQDYEKVIRHHIYKENYLDALEVLKKTTTSHKHLFYQFAPLLIQRIPRQLVQALVQQGHSLNPPKLLPALLLCQSSEAAASHAMEYLEFSIYQMQSVNQAEHNYLLSLYTNHRPERLKEYLAAQGADVTTVNYDVHFALRLCQEKGLTEACVQLSALLGLWESAIDLALTVSVELAIKTANQHQSEPELMKRLWLKIAEHVVKGKDDIKSAMEFLKKCDLLKIEDILPFFTDFVTIDDFKEAICTSLEEYNQHIKDLKEEMDEATKSAEIIVQEVSAFKNRYSIIKSADICSLCDLQLLLRPFYIFPCGHYFHSDCLTTEVLTFLSVEQRNKLLELQKQLNGLSGGQPDNLSTASTSLSAKDLIKSDIDCIVASDCYFCGDFMVESIDKPFILESEYSRVMKEWE